MADFRSKIWEGCLPSDHVGNSTVGDDCGLPQSARWQNYWAESLVKAWPNSRTARLEIHLENKLCAAVGCYRYPFPPPLPEAWMRRLARSLLWPINPINFHGPFHHTGVGDFEEVQRQLLLAVESLQRRWMAPAVRFVLLDPVQDQLFLDFLERQQFTILPGIIDTRMRIKWSDYEDYLQSALLSRHRKQLRKYADQARSAGVTFRVTSDVKGRGAQIHGLMANVASRNRCEPLLSADFAQAADRHLDHGDLVMVEAWKEGQLIGCTLNYRDQGCLTMKSLGLDYQQSQNLNIYRLLIAEGIRYAITQQLSEIRCGCSQYEIKQRMGFEQVQTLSAIRAKPRLLNKIFGYRLQNMRGHGQAAK